MSVLLPTHPSSFPRHHHDVNQHHAVSTQSPSQRMINRKRKADDEVTDGMSISPTNSPAVASRSLLRPPKKLKATDISGRPIAVHRLLETLDATALRSVLQTICESHPTIGSEVVSSAPRPSIEAVAEVLVRYQKKLQDAFPYGGNSGSDYAFNRVKQHLIGLIDALTDFTPYYLPPNENQSTTSLSYLDMVTKVVHDLPEWDSKSHQHYKDNAYYDLSKAWVLVVTEASKRGGGFLLYSGGWDQVVSKHNTQSGGRMQIVINALGTNLGWMGGMGSSSDISHGRNQLLNCTHGSSFLSIGVGHL
ncbi:Tethering factor for nuclear proteasome sts1 [Podosphaera aphanis]|nr:Tethering factor for nuclear proteasome sts1 [Podosphaera aphanis]